MWHKLCKDQEFVEMNISIQVKKLLVFVDGGEMLVCGGMLPGTSWDASGIIGRCKQIMSAFITEPANQYADYGSIMYSPC